MRYWCYKCMAFTEWKQHTYLGLEPSDQAKGWKCRGCGKWLNKLDTAEAAVLSEAEVNEVQRLLDPESKLEIPPDVRRLREIYRERLWQDEAWGALRSHDDTRWLLVLTEEVGEVARAILEERQEGEPHNVELELVQVAAVSLAWLECIARREQEAKTIQPQETHDE